MSTALINFHFSETIYSKCLEDYFKKQGFKEVHTGTQEV